MTCHKPNNNYYGTYHRCINNTAFTVQNKAERRNLRLETAKHSRAPPYVCKYYTMFEKSVTQELLKKKNLAITIKFRTCFGSNIICFLGTQ